MDLVSLDGVHLLTSNPASIPMKTLSKLIAVSVACAVTLIAGADDKSKPNEPIVTDLVVKQIVVDLELADDAPPDSFEKGPCLVVLGLVPRSAEGALNGFELQRQEFTKLPTDPKDLEAAEWKKVDINDAIQVLQSVEGLQEPILPEKLTDAAVTMPLPGLKEYDWAGIVLHPEFRKPNKPMTSRPILFRYIDFTVKPGKTYRYRVQLEVIDRDRTKPGDVNKVKNAGWSKPSKPQAVKQATEKSKTKDSKAAPEK